MVEVQRKAAAGIGFTQQTWDEGWGKSDAAPEPVTASDAVAAAADDTIALKEETRKGAEACSSDKIAPTPAFTLENVGNCSAYDLRQELERRLGGRLSS